MSEKAAEPKTEHDQLQAPPVRAAAALRRQAGGFKVPQAMAILALIFGLVGGSIGSFVFIRYFASAIPTDKKQLLVQESSAIIDVANEVSPSVVSITSKTLTRGFFGNVQEAEGAGTGMIVTTDGLILTNRHVVDDPNATYTVVTSDGKTHEGKVVSRDTTNDIAFMRINASGLKPVELADSGAVKVGQKVVAIGNALGQFQNTVTEGIVSGVSRGVRAGDSSSPFGGGTEDLQNLLQTDAAINPGNSGGPLVNLEGQVIGINTAVAGQAQNIGFAIPINEAKALIASVKSSGRIVRPYLGVRYVALDQQVATANDLKLTQGAWIQAANDANPGVQPNSPAAKAGLRDGDIIVKVAGDKIDATHSLQSLINKYKVGDKVKLTVFRDGKEQTLDATLEEAPATVE
jgi:serine protease Do